MALISFRLDLVPSRLFRDSLPHAFVADFIHWYDHVNDEVLFRPRTSPWTSGATCWRLQHDDNGGTWRLVNGPHELVSMTSRSARVLANIVRSVEGPQHIHVTLHTSTRVVDIVLPRLQISFFIDAGSCMVRSRQFHGMSIDHEQGIGTLAGLASKLVLRKGQSERMVLIPVPRKFGTTSITYSHPSVTAHVTVEINKNEATKVYAYDIDDVLGRIVDNVDLDAKLLLAYLHAVTSGCLPDPLTGLTGTETALNILASAAVLSFDLLTERNVDLLVQIALLSARRTFYPGHMKVMQEVSWDPVLLSLSQHPHFRTRANQIFDHAAKMQVFYPHHHILAVIHTARKRFSSGESILRMTTMSSPISDTW